jgi:Clostripain family
MNEGVGRTSGVGGHLVVAVLVAAAVLILAPVASALADAWPVPAPAPTASWTLIVYMDGDNNLEPWITHDIDQEMAAVGSNADVNIVALADRGSSPNDKDGSWTGARVFHVTPGMAATAENAALDVGGVDMGSPQTLVDLLSWARAAYPAQHYALFFWDHGWGWWPGESMRDDTSNDYLDVDEMRAAMEAAGGVDMVGFDTCLGQMIEVEAEFRGFARAMAGSQESIGYTGFSYDDILGGLQASPAMGAQKLAVLAAQSMRHHHDRWTWASSAISLGTHWDALIGAVSDLAWDLAIRLPGDRRDAALARRLTASPPQTYPEVRDLYGAALQLRAHVHSAAVRNDCTAVIRAMQRVVLYEWHLDKEGPVHGVSFYWPSTPAPPARGSSFSQWVNFQYYASSLQFARLTYWPDFLLAWGR